MKQKITLDLNIDNTYLNIFNTPTLNKDIDQLQ